MTTLQELSHQVLNQTLIGTYRGHYNALENDIGTTDTDITLKYAITAVGEGSFVSIDDELIYVTAVNPDGKVLTVVRGVRGTTVAPHVAKTPMEMNPRFPRVMVLAAMLDEARSWPNGVYRTETYDSGTAGCETSIDLSAVGGDILHVIKVWRQYTGSDPRWVVMGGYRFEPHMQSLYLRHPVWPSASLRFLLARKYDLTSWDVDTEIADCGMTEGMGEVLKLGAAWRLVMGREARRLFTETENEGRKAEEVPPQANSTLGRQLKAMRDLRLGDEVKRLWDLHGIRMG